MIELSFKGGNEIDLHENPLLRKSLKINVLKCQPGEGGDSLP